MKTKFRLKLLLTFFLLTAFLYHGAFGAYFFQDDWYSLSISKAGSFWEFVQLFIPRGDLIYYRPLGMQLPFFIFQSLFGINPLPFRIATFSLHLLNGILCFYLLREFLKQKRLAAIGGILYVTSVSHMTIFYWAATFAFILAPTFYFSGVLTYIYRKEKLSLVLFSLGLLTNEMLVTFPLILTLYHFIFRTKKTSRTLGIFWLILLLYMFVRIKFGSVLGQGEYGLTLHLKQILVNTRDYLLWAFNWPEEIRSHFSTLFVPNFSMAKSFPLEWLGLGIFTVTHTLITLFLLIKTGFKKRKRIIFFGLGWFVATMIPVIFFSAHSFSYYLPIPLFGLLLTYMLLLRDASIGRYKKLFSGIILTVWLVSSGITIRFNTNHHWTVKRARLSGEMMQVMRKTFPTLPADAIVIVFDNGDKTGDQKWSWGDQYALQVVYNSPGIYTFYSFTNDGNDLYKIFPENISRNRVYKLPCKKTLTCW